MQRGGATWDGDDGSAECAESNSSAPVANVPDKPYSEIA